MHDLGQRRARQATGSLGCPLFWREADHEYLSLTPCLSKKRRGSGVSRLEIRGSENASKAIGQAVMSSGSGAVKMYWAYESSPRGVRPWLMAQDVLDKSRFLQGVPVPFFNVWSLISSGARDQQSRKFSAVNKV